MVLADDLDVINDPGTSPQERGAAYYRLNLADFSTISLKLAKMIAAKGPITRSIGIMPATNDPWNFSQFGVDTRIELTFDQLWKFHLDSASRRPHYTQLLVSILDNPEYGDKRVDTVFRIGDLLRPYAAALKPPELSKAELLKHLDTFARDAKNAVNLRNPAGSILFKQGDPNACLAVMIEIIDAEGEPLQRGAYFSYWVDADDFGRLTDDNKKLCIRKAFEWLEKMDDGKSGSASSHAIHIGQLLGIAPVPGARDPFAPGLTLPQYQGAQNSTYAQATVNNARAWWAQHKKEF